MIYSARKTAFALIKVSVFFSAKKMQNIFARIDENENSEGTMAICNAFSVAGFKSLHFRPSIIETGQFQNTAFSNGSLKPLSKAYVLILVFGPFTVADRRKHIKKYRCFGIHAKTYLVWSEPGHVWKKGIFPLCLSLPWLCLKKSLEGKVPFPMQQKALSNLLNNFLKY